jgi:hypothetical protein
MADDLSIQAATSMMHMMAQRSSSEIGVKVLKMQAQQDQSIAALIANLAEAGKNGGYSSQGMAVAAVAEGGIDTTA